MYPTTLPVEDELRFPLDPYGARYQINRCARCELLYASPILKEDLVGRLYTEISGVNVAAGEDRNVRRTMDSYYNVLRPHLTHRRRFLDVGCDVGLPQRTDLAVEHVDLQPHLGGDQRTQRACILARVADRSLDRGRAVTVQQIEMRHTGRFRRRVLGKECRRIAVDAQQREPVVVALGIAGEDDILVGRIRKDLSDPSGKSISMFCAGDQLLKGAALNAVQIAERLLK